MSSAEGAALSQVTVSVMDFLTPFMRSHMSFNSALMSNQYGRFSVDRSSQINIVDYGTRMSFLIYYCVMSDETEDSSKLLYNYYYSLR